MKIVITGETGFVGYHLTQHLRWIKGFDIIPVGRDFTANTAAFAEADWVIHLAGVNRAPSDEEVYQGNINLANDLVGIFRANGKAANVIFSSSTQEDSNNAYGNSKKEAAAIIAGACAESGNQFISLKIPNVFGPFCRPNYNSFVATFCHRLANGEEPVVMTDKDVDLCYVQHVCKVIADTIDGGTPASFTPYVHTISVSTVLGMLKEFNEKYRVQNGIIPALQDEFTLNLFNTFRSYLEPVHPLLRRVDDRGFLTEMIKCEGSQTQVFYSVTKPGIVRGNHFHFGKVERFMILKGTALIEMRKTGTTEIKSWKIADTDDITIDMPVFWSHSLTNIGEDELICAFWTQEIFDPNRTDTYFDHVRSQSS